MTTRIEALELESGLHDSLGGVPLKDGDRIYVRWPSGFVQPAEVKVSVVIHGTLRDGSTVEIPCHKAYMEVQTTGSPARVYLQGFEAQRA